MPNVNFIELIGHVTRDPVMKYTQAGVGVARFGMAVNRWKKDEQGENEVDFFDITCFRQKAEFTHSYVKKGRLVRVVGRHESRKHTGDDGIERVYWGVVADDVLPLDRRPEGEEGTAEERVPVGAGAGANAGGRPAGGKAKPAPKPPSDDDLNEGDPFADE
jgi:single-strand DNA-binding protein